MTKINWDKVIDDVKLALNFFSDRGIKPTLRTMFYRLVALEQLPNTKNSYKGLSKATVDARKDGRLPLSCFADEGRIVKGDVPEFQEAHKVVTGWLEAVEDLPENYFTRFVPRWHNQDTYVEIWIEKLALADTVMHFSQERQVRIVVNRGYSGLSFFVDNIKRIKTYVAQGKAVKILYLGDFDPSGADMDRYIQDTLDEFGISSNVEFERIAITKQHIEAFHLPQVPDDAETMEKVNRDSRTAGFIAEHGQLYVVELDALLAVVPDDFERIINDAIDKHFNDSKFEELKKQNSPCTIREQLIDEMTDILQDLRQKQADECDREEVSD